MRGFGSGRVIRPASWLGVLAACALPACGGAAHPAGGTPDRISVRWIIDDDTCEGDDCPGGSHVKVSVVVARAGAAPERRDVGRLSADSDDGPVGKRRCGHATEKQRSTIGCSGTPEQNTFSVELRGGQLVVVRRAWIYDSPEPAGEVVATIPLEANAGPVELVDAPEDPPRPFTHAAVPRYHRGP